MRYVCLITVQVQNEYVTEISKLLICLLEHVMLSQIDELSSHDQSLFNVAEGDVELVKHGVSVFTQPPLVVTVVSVRTTRRLDVEIHLTQNRCDVSLELQ